MRPPSHNRVRSNRGNFHIYSPRTRMAYLTKEYILDIKILSTMAAAKGLQFVVLAYVKRELREYKLYRQVSGLSPSNMLPVKGIAFDHP